MRKSESSGSDCNRAVRIPSVATSSSLRAEKRRSNRICHPTSSPIVQPLSNAMRRVSARAATRRGWSRIVRPMAVSAGGMRVVFPEPGGATTTANRSRRACATISSTCASIGSGVCTTSRIMANRKDDIDYNPEGSTPPQEKEDPTNAGYDEAAHKGGAYGVREGEGGVFGTTGGGTYKGGLHVERRPGIETDEDRAEEEK